MKSLCQKMKKVDLLAQESLKNQDWKLFSNAKDYFEKVSQGERYDDALYGLITSHILEEVKSILDVGAGEGKLAQSLLNDNFHVNCLEPSKSRSKILKEKGFFSIEKNFCDYQSSKVYDCCIVLRSIGVVSKNGSQYLLKETLEKLLGLSKIQLIIISKAIEDVTMVTDEFKSLKVFQKESWLYHHDLLTLMQKSPNLSYIHLSVERKYSSKSACIKQDFPLDPVHMVEDFLNLTAYEKEGFYFRKVNLSFPLVSVEICK
ncbi:hypothetical protein MJH12_17570 [bacterium]|nr:hypothetical protein [bacterium]